MQTMNEIIQSLRKLAPDEREQVRAELDALEQAEDNRLEADEERRKAAMQDWLAMAGTAHSDHTDVSENKGKYLAEAYATKP